MNTAASAARSRSASLNTIIGFFPPNSKCTRFNVSAPCFIIIAPVRLSPTKAMALISGCSVNARPASSPKPLTMFQTPAGTPEFSAISIKRRADSGDNSAGLCTTVHPAANAGAIFHVDSMKGVFQGVIMPTGPMGVRDVTFICVLVNSDFPSAANGA